MFKSDCKANSLLIQQWEHDNIRDLPKCETQLSVSVSGLKKSDEASLILAATGLQQHLTFIFISPLMVS